MFAFDKALKIAGGVSKMARRLNTTPQTVSNWRTRGVSIRRCADVARLTGVSVHRLRPDVFRRTR